MRALARLLGQVALAGAGAATALAAWAGVPAMPTGTAPGTTSASGPVQAGSAVTLRWNAVAGATSYTVNVRDLATNALSTGKAASNSITAHLEAGKPYRWNVAACNASGCSAATTALYFQTPLPPRTLSGLTVACPASVNEGGTASCSATARFSDNSTQVVTGSASWADNSPFASFTGAGVLAAAQVSSSQPVTVTASYTYGGATRSATAAMTVVDVPPPRTLSSLSVSCPASVNEGGTAACSATARFSDNSTLAVTGSAAWTENSPYAAFSGAGVLAAGTVSSNQPVTVSATYTYNGVTRAGTAAMTILDVVRNDDHGNTTATATLIKSGSTTQGKIEVAGDVDVFKVEVASAGNLDVSTTGTTDTYGYLLDAAGRELTTNDDEITTVRNFRITWNVSPGTYFIKVRHQSATGTGSYALAYALGAPSTAPTNAVLLLHGMNSNPHDAWNSLVLSKWSGRCPIIYGGRFENAVNQTGTEACYRVRFGSVDATSKLTGLEGVSCSNQTTGCNGDFTRIYDKSGGTDLGVEVAQALSAIRSKLGEKTRILLVAHSRGGLAARAALQVPASSNDLATVKGLITTGSPHEGSPLGKIYKYLADNCFDARQARINAGDCKDDWQAADFLRDKIDLRRPTVNFLSPLSADIKDLKQNKDVFVQRKIQVAKLVYSGAYLGHLATGYSAWDRPGPQMFDQFSNRSKRYALCDNLTVCAKSENDAEFSGDGIVTASSQSSADTGGTSSLFPGGNVYHTDESGRTTDLMTAIRNLAWK